MHFLHQNTLEKESKGVPAVFSLKINLRMCAVEGPQPRKTDTVVGELRAGNDVAAC